MAFLVSTMWCNYSLLFYLEPVSIFSIFFVLTDHLCGSTMILKLRANNSAVFLKTCSFQTMFRIRQIIEVLKLFKRYEKFCHLWLAWTLSQMLQIVLSDRTL